VKEQHSTNKKKLVRVLCMAGRKADKAIDGLQGVLPGHMIASAKVL
jgi:hypothetical protein